MRIIRVLAAGVVAGGLLLAAEEPAKTAPAENKSSWWQTPAPRAARGVARKGAAVAPARRDKPEDSSRLAIEPLRWPRPPAPDHSRWVITVASDK